MGQVAIRALRDAQASSDLEVRNRARDLLVEIEKNRDTPLAPVTARLVALRKPAGAAEALLAFLPFAEEDALVAEVQAALNALTWSAARTT